MFMLGGLLLADTHTGVITKIEDGKISVTIYEKGEKKGTAKTFKLNKDAKFYSKSMDDEEKEVKLKDFRERLAKQKVAKGKRRGVGARIETTGEGDDETVTKITFDGGKSKVPPKKDE
jgi:hypothetical protein